MYATFEGQNSPEVFKGNARGGTATVEEVVLTGLETMRNKAPASVEILTIVGRDSKTHQAKVLVNMGTEHMRWFMQ